MSSIIAKIAQESSMRGRWHEISAAIWNAERLKVMMWLAVAIGVTGRICTFSGEPLWFDETFTGVIATQSNFASFFEWISYEIGGPVYYSLLWFWQSLAGDSNNALRFPSLIFSLLSLVIAVRATELSDRTRLVYVALTALTASSYLQANEARSYALLALLCGLQLLAFIRLLRRPTTPNAIVWVSISTTAILTHYHAGFISLIQGLIYLGYCKRTALKTWPAILCLTPAIVWLEIQYNCLSSYAAPGNNWYSLLNIEQVPLIVPIALGFGWLAYLISAIAIYFGIGWFARRSTKAPLEKDYAPVLAALSGVLAVLAITALAMILPSFSPRYLFPSGPAVLLGAALALAHLGQVSTKALLYALMVLAAFSASFWVQLMTLTGDRNPLAFERASAWIMANGDPQRVVYYWDNPTGDFSSVNHLRDVGGFFFAREGHYPQIVIPRGLSAETDPNKHLGELAGSDGRTAIMWLADKGVPGTHAILHDERLSHNPAWRCHKFGSSHLFVLACLPVAKD